MSDLNFIVKNGLYVNGTLLTANGGKVGVNTATGIVALTVASNDAIQVPVGNTGQRPAGVAGYFRYNPDISAFEGYAGGAWAPIGGPAPGANTQVIFNDSSAANSAAGMTFNKTTNTFSIGNTVTAGAAGLQFAANSTVISIGNSTVSGSMTQTTLGVGSLSVNTTVAAVAGSITATGDITANFSDERLKTIYGPIWSALDKVRSLQGFTYAPNKLAVDLGAVPKDQLNETRVGVSAQEVQRVLPEVVKPAPFNQDYLTVQYELLVPLLIEAIKELEQKLEARTSDGCQCGGSCGR